ncbi:MAG: 50S ribosomal protein L2 [Planctomycetes bacterium]|nr:50S ribosomal protein L2 [Planctomycetota bacterium]
MGIKIYKPTSPGRRNMSGPDFSEITRSKPEKSLLRPLKGTGGRNNQGRTTARFRGGGHKRRYRVIDFTRDKDGVPAEVLSIEYDPNRTCRIALLEYADGEKRYVLAPEGLRVGQRISNGPDAEPRVGNCLPLQRVPLGLFAHNIELQPGKGAQLVRSAGAAAQVSAREGEYVHVILPSGEIRQLPGACRCTIGRLSNSDHQNVKLGKAGRVRWMGHRPHVSGNAQNPASHPMGGGEGHRAGGRHPCSPKGLLAKGGKTRRGKRYSDRFIVRRRKK